MMSYQPLILISNDDGITAPGLRVLVEVMSTLGEVIVVAPDKPQSAMGHAITVTQPLRLKPNNIFGTIKAFECSGTPADCVKLALDKVCHRRPDIMVSGINHGPNYSINVIYSGTMSAAVEAAIDGVQAIGFSLCDYSLEADFESCRTHIKHITETILKHPLPYGTLLNVNIPKSQELKGIRVCRQASAKYAENFDERLDPSGNTYYWMTGKLINLEEEDNDTDLWAIAHDYISVVPTKFDLTSNSFIQHLKQLI
ncbi:MAG: 5'/3'-nucleotidase SurE [Bacteroidia bacterium]|nr:5'/3'-nucleotidase SurE [Bacteroidia bacterium]